MLVKDNLQEPTEKPLKMGTGISGKKGNHLGACMDAHPEQGVTQHWGQSRYTF